MADVAFPLLLADLAATYDQVVVDEGRQPLLFMLVAFGGTFGATRFITHSIRSERFSWLGNAEVGETHIHHLVWGILLVLVAGFVAIGVNPGPPEELSAILFGIGAALTLDEFALWLHLDDVYWSEQGRQSIDAVIVFALFAGLALVLGFPIAIGTEGDFTDVLGFMAGQALMWGFCIVCFMKGKLIWGVVGLFVQFAGLIGATRLAKPDSSWAKKRYEPEKIERSRSRYAPDEASHKPAL